MSYWVRPVNAPITQYWGNGSSSYGIGGHPGTDYGCPMGTPIVAASDGIVIYAGPASGFGDHAVSIYHPADNVSTTYGHMEAHYVGYGAGVRAGQPIGLADSQGQSTGSHLHFEVRPGNQAFGGNPPNIDSDKWLHDHGAYGSTPLQPAGQLTARDRAAITAMQVALHVHPDGGWGAITDHAMFVLALNASARPGQYNPQVQAVQKAWNMAPGDCDGIWGPKTAGLYKLLRYVYLNK
jgi:murein DD-endopeptidase MepM/ murein hydrolase activator NlpD